MPNLDSVSEFLYSQDHMYALYSLFLLVSMIFLIPLYMIKLRLFRKERIHLKERLGWSAKLKPEPDRSVWFHAVSVGEVLSLQSVIEKLKERNPGLSIHFSSLTSTGLRVAKEKLKGVDSFFFVPFDFAWTVRKFLRLLRPTVLVLAESEFWPRLLREASRETKGVLLINGRISARSFRRYHRFRFVFKHILANVDHFMVQTEKERDYLIRIGISPVRLEVAGNLKTEIALPQLDESKKAELQAKFNVSRSHKLILAGSTHRGEDERLIEAFLKAKEQGKEVDLILAPRHPARTEELIRCLEGTSLLIRKRSELRAGMKWDVLLLDTIGELATLYALCDAAFIGGSLIPWGGGAEFSGARFLREAHFFRTPYGQFRRIVRSIHRRPRGPDRGKRRRPERHVPSSERTGIGEDGGEGGAPFGLLSGRDRKNGGED